MAHWKDMFNAVIPTYNRTIDENKLATVEVQTIDENKIKAFGDYVKCIDGKSSDDANVCLIKYWLQTGNMQAVINSVINSELKVKVLLAEIKQITSDTYTKNQQIKDYRNLVEILDIRLCESGSNGSENYYYNAYINKYHNNKK